jgi:hypothetical protein
VESGRGRTFLDLSEAKKRHEERRLALAEKGFIYSDMDM